MGRYDITVKYFAAKYPQAYIRLALGAVFGQVQAVSAFRLLDKKLPEVELEVDFLAEVTHAGETFAVERADLYTGLWVFGGLRYSRELLRSLIRREAMKESPTFMEIFEERAVQSRRDDIVDVLSIRFGDVPPDITDELAEIDNLETLRHLHRLAVRCQSIADFRAQMASAMTA